MARLLPLVLFIPLISISQKNYTSLFDQYMNAQVQVNDFSGSVLIAQKGKIIYEKAFGLGDREWNAPNTVETRFELGSITKQFTATCILKLAEIGKLNLDDKLSKYFPGYPKGDSVTLHMLLTHTSGISSYTSMPNFQSLSTLSLSKDSMISYFKDKPYDFSPGKNWNYSNSGYFLLGCIVEKVSNQSWKTYIQNHIFNVLDMNNSGIDQLDSIIPMHSSGYTKQKNSMLSADYMAMEWAFSAGSLYSTVEDLYKWDRSLYSNTILANASLQKMLTPGKGNYGYGVSIDSLENHYVYGTTVVSPDLLVTYQDI